MSLDKFFFLINNCYFLLSMSFFFQLFFFFQQISFFQWNFFFLQIFCILFYENMLDFLLFFKQQFETNFTSCVIYYLILLIKFFIFQLFILNLLHFQDLLILNLESIYFLINFLFNFFINLFFKKFIYYFLFKFH